MADALGLATSERPRTPGPLALVGGAELGPGNEPQDRLLAEAAAGGPAFVLATAAARHRPELAVANAAGWFARFGLAVEELPAIGRRQANGAGNAERARAGRFFYLVGGDPGIVPATLRDTAVWSAVTEAWRSGAALAGSSAGAMALGEWTLTRDRRPGDANRRATAGLGLVPGLAVIPHFETFGEGWVASARDALPDVTLVGLDERTAAVWTPDGVWRAMGPGGVTVIRSDDTARTASGGEIDGLPQPGFA
jgi:cyanophycinase